MDEALVLVVVLLTASLAVGCVGNVGSPAGMDRDSQDLANSYLAETYVSECPQGDTESEDSVCASVIEQSERSLYEPNVAIHPADPRITVLLANSREEPAPPGDYEGASLSMFVSEDGGGDWTEVPMPQLDGRQFLGDPSIAFDRDGRLHIAGMLPTDASTGYDVGYAATDDLGADWVHSTVVSSNKTADRPWLGFTPDDQPIIAWSDYFSVNWTVVGDDGAVASSGSVEGCELASRPVSIDEGVLLGCRDGDRFRFHRVAGQAEPTSEVSNFTREGSHPWHLVAGSGSSVLFATSPEDGNEVSVFVGDDGGRSWTRLTFSDDLHVNEDWEATEVFWAEPDPAGNLHLLLQERLYLGDRDDVFSPLAERVAHVVVDPGSETVVHQHLVDEGSTTPRGEPGPSADPDPNLNHAYGIAFGPSRGIFAWASEGRILASLTQIVGPNASDTEVAVGGSPIEDSGADCPAMNPSELERTGTIGPGTDYLEVEVAVGPPHPPIEVGYTVDGSTVWLPAVGSGTNETFSVPVWSEQVEDQERTWTFHSRTSDAAFVDGCFTEGGAPEASISVRSMGSSLPSPVPEG
ncbi:hypothetical protein BRD56_02760 [Thermoplasmatales archaeon SW_10_69_26]|nr:MAG: hypothetical protein BRD56_02760 [Thermoplasmatales archaeon SW_10_69_26]